MNTKNPRKQCDYYNKVATAIGKNPVAFLIPYHRVIPASGHTEQYHWGSLRKKAMIAWEAAQTASSKRNIQCKTPQH